jgi:hypothetical protein
MILTFALALVHPVVAALLATLPILGVGMVPILRVRAAKRGEAGYGSLYGMITERSLTDLDKSEVVARLRPVVERRELPATTLSQVDTGLPVSVLHLLGYTDATIRKSEAVALAQMAAVGDLVKGADLLKKGASERTLRQEDLDEPPRRKGRLVQVDADELERLRKVARVVQKFLNSGGGPSRGVIPDDDAGDAEDDEDERRRR